MPSGRRREASEERCFSCFNALAFANIVTLTINADSSVIVKPWKNLTITDGGGTYDTKTNTFNIWYFYTSGGKIYKMIAKLVKSTINDDE